jgi:hypothetical protein
MPCPLTTQDQKKILEKSSSEAIGHRITTAIQPVTMANPETLTSGGSEWSQSIVDAELQFGQARPVYGGLAIEG